MQASASAPMAHIRSRLVYLRHMQRPDLDAPASEWLVYGDALQVANDPRGELISLVHGADEKARDAYVHKHAEALLGPAAKAYRQGAYRLTWKHCFVDTAEVITNAESNGAHWVKVILESPASTELRELALRARQGDVSEAITAIATVPWPERLSSLAIIDDRASRSLMQISTEFGIDENLVKFGSLGALWKLPQLAHLRLELADVQYVDFGEIDGSHLESLVIRSLRWADGWNGDAADLSTALGETAWPKLQELELRLCETFAANIPGEREAYNPTYTEDMERVADRLDEGDLGDNDGVSWDEIEPLLENLVKSPLRRLALTSFDSCDELLAVLLRTGLPPTLKVLDLSDSSLDRRHVEWMRENAKLFTPLTELVLERTAIEEADAKLLQGLGPAIRWSHGETAPTYRYIVGSE